MREPTKGEIGKITSTKEQARLLHNTNQIEVLFAKQTTQVCDEPLNPLIGEPDTNARINQIKKNNMVRCNENHSVCTLQSTSGEVCLKQKGKGSIFTVLVEHPAGNQ